MRNIQFEIDILEVPRIFDSLKVIEGENENFLSGTLKIVDDDNKLWDSYDIEIHSSDKYPNAFPKLFETSNSFLKMQIGTSMRAICLAVWIFLRMRFLYVKTALK